MMSPEGVFYSSQDAETHHEEGRFFVWTPAELAAALPDKAAAEFVKKVYGADGKPNFENQYHILHLSKSLEERAGDLKMTEAELTEKLEPLRKRLYLERAKRDRPFRNEIALTAWSGLMIGAFAEAATSLGDKRYLDDARKSASFVLERQKAKDGRLLRTYGGIPGQAPKAAGAAYLEDYAFLVHGLLNLHDATKEKRWLDEAVALTDTQMRFHGEEKKGGYFMTANDHEKLFARAKDQYDGAQPSGNSVAIANLVRLAKSTGDARFAKEADRCFRYFAGSLKSYGPGMVGAISALDRHLEK
jgi:uncharacterized protein YyaL (SSP411 family)